jgi:hypothetical protein
MRLKNWITLALFVILPSTLQAAVTQIGSPWAASTINAAITNARDGDIIELTGSGSVTWTSQVIIPDTKGITLRVQNGTNTPKGSANFPITVTTNYGVVIFCSDFKSVTRISGFKFRGNPGEVITVDGRGRGTDTLGAYRIDNNYFDSNSSSSIIYLSGGSGELTGLIDNNTFHDPNDDNYTIRIRETWKGSSTTCYGYDSWKREFLHGGNRFHFIEDNLFQNDNVYQRHSVSSDGAGGRYVVRYNTFNATVSGSPDYIDAHGDGCQGLGVGARGGEIYGNSFQGLSSSVGRNMNLRGGWWLIYDNTFATLGYGSSPIILSDYRASASDCWQVQTPSLCWPGEPQCATTSNFASLYPLPGQIQHTFTWNNVYKGSSRSPEIISDDYIPNYIQFNRDVFVASSLADAKSKGLNTGYAPYTYPHPLRAISMEILPPKNVRVN